jgi:phospholipase/carboxylesterase
VKRWFILVLWVVGSFCAFSQKIDTDLTYLVHEPAKKNNKTPVLILLHGYRSNETDLFDLSKVLDPALIVFSLRAPHPAESGFAWYNLEFLPDQQFRYNYQEAQQSRRQVLAFISKACAAYGVDSAQVFLMGFSQGAILSYDIAMAAPQKIKGVLALSGRMMEESKTMKTDAAKLAAVKFFIAHGYSDNVIKIADAEKAHVFLKSKKVTDLTYNAYEMPHTLNGKELNDIKRWLTKTISPIAIGPGKEQIKK